MKDFSGLITNKIPDDPLGTRNSKDYDRGEPFAIPTNRINDVIDAHKNPRRKNVEAILVRDNSTAAALRTYRAMPREIGIWVNPDVIYNGLMEVYTDKNKAKKKINNIMRLNQMKQANKATTVPTKGSTISFNYE